MAKPKNLIVLSRTLNGLGGPLPKMALLVKW